MGEDLPLAARLLRLATDLDARPLRGLSDGTPCAAAARRRRLRPALLDAAARGRRGGARNLQPGGVAELQRTMTIAADVLSSSGALLIGRGSSVTAGVVERLRNHEENGNLPGRLLVEVA